MVRREKSNYIIQSVSHSLDVLEQFSGEAEELGVTELSKRLKLHKNNVFRLLATLESRGYIEQNRGTENYRLGVRCLQIGQRYADQMGLLQQARRIMADLAKSCRETVLLAICRNHTMVTIGAVESDRPVRIVPLLGDFLPLHCTAVGKVYLAFLPADEREQSLLDPLPRHSERTLTDRQALLQQLKKVATHGYAVDLVEFADDMHSIAVPVRDYTKAVVAALAVAGPSQRLAAERLEKTMAPLVAQAGQELSMRLGYSS